MSKPPINARHVLPSWTAVDSKDRIVSATDNNWTVDSITVSSIVLVFYTHNTDLKQIKHSVSNYKTKYSLWTDSSIHQCKQNKTDFE